MESILTSIKKMLGITEECTDFDADIIMHINSVFMILRSLGVGPEEGFVIEDEIPIWDDFLPDAALTKMAAVKTYVYLKVKLVFDPPLSSSTVESMNRMISELEWRLNEIAESNDRRDPENE